MFRPTFAAFLTLPLIAAPAAAGPLGGAETVVVAGEDGQKHTIKIRPNITRAQAKALAQRANELKVAQTTPAASPATAVPAPADPGQALTNPPTSLDPPTVISQTPLPETPAEPSSADAESPAASDAAMSKKTEGTGDDITITPNPLAASDSEYRAIYNSIPFSRSAYIVNPSYRHDLTAALLTGQPVEAKGVSPAVVEATRRRTEWSPYRPYIPAQWDFYQAEPPAFRLLNPFLNYGPDRLPWSPGAFGPFGL